MRNDLLHVVGVYSNPNRYESRRRNLRAWIDRTLAAGVHLTLVTHAFGERPHEFDPITDAALLRDINLVQLRGGPEHQLWLKEALVNVGLASISQRSPEAQYLCWEDTDIIHASPNWAAETVHMLQHHRVGQTWTHSVDLDARGNVIANELGNAIDRSFCGAWVAGEIHVPSEGYGTQVRNSRALLTGEMARIGGQHYGYSWAIRKDALKGIGKLMDWLIVGSADYHMALSFAGLREHIRGDLTPGYQRRLREFWQRCDDHIRQDMGVLPGTIMHEWHGHKVNRFYIKRFDVLRESGFDPDVDLASDVNGLPTLVTDNRILRDGLRRYDSQRNEDAI